MTTSNATQRKPAQKRRARRRKLAAWVAASSAGVFAVLTGFLGGQLAAGNDPALGASVQAPAPSVSDGVSEQPAPLVTRTS